MISERISRVFSWRDAAVACVDIRFKVNMLALIVLFVVTFLLVDWYNAKPKKYPPGPPCLPVIGSALFVRTQNFHLHLEKLRKIYGPVVGFKFGYRHVVGVGGPKQVKEVLSREEFQGRPEFPLIDPGIMFTEGEYWSAQRRFTIRHLKDFGFGKKSVEYVVMEEADDFFRNVLTKNDVIQVEGLFGVSSINILWAMMGGERFSHNDEAFKRLLECLQKSFRSGNVTGGFLLTFPFLAKIFNNFENQHEQQETKNMLYDFLQEKINSHKATMTEEPRDFIDVYLMELEKSGLHESFSENTLKYICNDLFSAGAESMSNNLGFCLLYCVLYPEWQEQLYEEIEKYGASSDPYLEGKDRLPKVEAFLSEVMRCNTIASLTVPHRALVDTHLDGYFIPKDSMLLISLWSVLQDKDIWKDPENFRPERFLDENNSYKKDAGWLPAFGMGKRVCPGEALAKKTVFVFLIALLREYRFSIPEGHPKPSTVCLPGFTNAPRPFLVKVTKRQKVSART